MNSEQWLKDRSIDELLKMERAFKVVTERNNFDNVGRYIQINDRLENIQEAIKGYVFRTADFMDRLDKSDE